MNSEGLTNDVFLSGELKFKSVKSVGSGKKMFKGKINNINVVAWDELASSMDESVDNGAIVTIRGTINERKYKGTCKKCGNEETRYWTDVTVYQFKKENKNNG